MNANDWNSWQVAPAEIEAVLLQHPDIVDAAVVGILGVDGETELSRAYVVRRRRQADVGMDTEDAEMLSAAEVYQYSRSRLASYKALDGGVCFVETIPRTPSGKILRRKLAELHEYNGEIVRKVTGQTRMVTAQPPRPAEGTGESAETLPTSKTNGSKIRRSPHSRSNDSKDDSETPRQKVQPPRLRVQKRKSHESQFKHPSWEVEELAKAIS